MKRIVLFMIFILISNIIYSQEWILDRIYSNKGYIFYQYQEYNFVIVLVNDLQKTLDDWNSSGNNKIIDSTTKVGINEPISFFIVYSINEEKTNLRLYYHISILNSDRTFINGRLRDNQYLGLKISNGIPEINEVYISENLKTIIFNENYKKGNYHFHVEIYDDMKILGLIDFSFNIE